jgi:hypothetical protein
MQKAVTLGGQSCEAGPFTGAFNFPDFSKEVPKL